MISWISLIGAAGIGAIIIKILDIVWLQKRLERSENRKWLRDQKLKAYSELSKAVLSIGLGEHIIKNLKNPYEFYSISSQAILLLENDDLVEKINQYVVNWDKLVNENLSEIESNIIYINLVEKSKSIVKELHKDLIIT